MLPLPSEKLIDFCEILFKLSECTLILINTKNKEFEGGKLVQLPAVNVEKQWGTR